MYFWGRWCRDRMVVGFIPTYDISVYHHWCWEFETCSWWGIFDTTLCNKFCQQHATGRWFSPVSSTNKTDRHDITEILLKVALIITTHVFFKFLCNTKLLNNLPTYNWFFSKCLFLFCVVAGCAEQLSSPERHSPPGFLFMSPCMRYTTWLIYMINIALPVIVHCIRFLYSAKKIQCLCLYMFTIYLIKIKFSYLTL